jgi:Polyketide cyclase / dehydrase and lipid transport
MRLILISACLFLSGCLEQSATVVIHAPIEVVWAYTGDSAQAAKWSTFFDHITPLPGIPEGQVGALRRCYRRPDGSGLNWDEKTTFVEAPTERHLLTFNIQRSPIPGMDRYEFNVIHKLRAISPEETELTFSSTLAKMDFRFFGLYKLIFGGIEGARIVKDNLENIKMLIEAHGATPADLHPFRVDPNPYFDIQ